MRVEAERVAETKQRTPQAGNFKIMPERGDGFGRQKIDRAGRAIHGNGAGVQGLGAEAEVLLSRRRAEDAVFARCAVAGRHEIVAGGQAPGIFAVGRVGIIRAAGRAAGVVNAKLAVGDHRELVVLPEVACVGWMLVGAAMAEIKPAVREEIVEQRTLPRGEDRVGVGRRIGSADAVAREVGFKIDAMRFGAERQDVEQQRFVGLPVHMAEESSAGGRPRFPREMKAPGIDAGRTVHQPVPINTIEELLA